MKGYGWFRGPHGKIGAHRMAYILEHGPVPPGKCVCHRCDNPLCVNPKHLFLGTHADNIRDRDNKGRAASGKRSGAYTHPERVARGHRSGRHTKPECTARGERVATAKITAGVVRNIRRKYKHGVSVAALSRKYTLSWSQTNRIARGESWRHVK